VAGFESTDDSEQVVAQAPCVLYAVLVCQKLKTLQKPSGIELAGLPCLKDNLL
jgi:hypothetical protein